MRTTAEEIAEKICAEWHEEWGKNSLHLRIARSLTAFRNEALEDGAKVADTRCQCPHHISIAFEIRALKK